jgi:tripartite-type tricarboxylate transporter receptor subunit TctC
MIRTSNVLAALPAMVACAWARPQFLQRAVRIFNPDTPGGGTDSNGCFVMPKLTERCGQSVIVDHRPGGNAMAGSDKAVKSAPDGHTVMMSASSQMATNVSLFKRIPLRPARGFGAGDTGLCVAGDRDREAAAGAKTIIQMIVAAGHSKLLLAGVDAASPKHLAEDWLKRLANIEMVHLAFKGGGPALNDYLREHVPIGFLPLLPVVVHAEAGRLNALGITAATRAAALPDVPTLKESGVPGSELKQSYGVLLPARATRAIVDRLKAGMDLTQDLPDVKERLTSSGTDVVANVTPAQIGQFVCSQIDNNRKIIEAAAVKCE